jgi:hypothetical protein
LPLKFGGELVCHIFYQQNDSAWKISDSPIEPMAFWNIRKNNAVIGHGE